MNFVNDGLVFRERLGLWNIFAPFTRGCGEGGELIVSTVSFQVDKTRSVSICRRVLCFKVFYLYTQVFVLSFFFLLFGSLFNSFFFKVSLDFFFFYLTLGRPRGGGGGIHPHFQYFYNSSETVYFYSIRYLIPEIEPF